MDKHAAYRAKSRSSVAERDKNEQRRDGKASKVWHAWRIFGMIDGLPDHG